MSRTLDMLVKQVIGPGHVLSDDLPTPIAFRGIPTVVGGVPLVTPAGAKVLTGSNASTVPSPQ